MPASIITTPTKINNQSEPASKIAGGDLSMIMKNKLVDEIAELDNDESPNINKSKGERKVNDHMGFAPAFESATIASQ